MSTLTIWKTGVGEKNCNLWSNFEGEQSSYTPQQDDFSFFVGLLQCFFLLKLPWVLLLGFSMAFFTAGDDWQDFSLSKLDSL